MPVKVHLHPILEQAQLLIATIRKVAKKFLYSLHDEEIAKPVETPHGFSANITEKRPLTDSHIVGDEADTQSY